MIEHVGRQQRPLIIIEATGTLGKAFARLCTLRSIPYRLLTIQQINNATIGQFIVTLRQLNPWAVVNTEGYEHVDEAEQSFEACHNANVRGPALLAAICSQLHIQFVTFSSDQVFDGKQRRPYTESDSPSPINTYGRTKAEGEGRVMALYPSALIVRTGALFGPWDTTSFVTVTLKQLAAGRHVIAANDAILSATYIPDLVHASLTLLLEKQHGIWHLANTGVITWANLARRAAEHAGVDADGVEACPTAALGLVARRPLYSVLGSERGILLPSLDDALARYLEDREVRWNEQLAG